MRHLLGAVQAVLGVADDLVGEITGNDGLIEDEAQDEIRDQAAKRIRVAINAALEGKP
jgi:hypothetical protein